MHLATNHGHCNGRVVVATSYCLRRWMLVMELPMLGVHVGMFVYVFVSERARTRMRVGGFTSAQASLPTWLSSIVELSD